MTQPIQTSFLLQTALSLTAATLMTGCATETMGIAAGGGLLVLGAGAWAAQRYLSRLRGPSSSAVPHAVAVLRQNPDPQKSPSSEENPSPPATPEIEDARPAVRERLLKLHPVFGDASYELVTSALVSSIVDSAPKSLGQVEKLTDTLIEAKVQGLVEIIEARRGIGNPKEALLLRALKPERPLQSVPAPKVIENSAPDFSSPASITQESIATLLCVALKAPKDASARRAVGVLSGMGLTHPKDEIVQKAADALGELARHGSQETSLHDFMEYFGPEDREHLKEGTIRVKDIQARYAGLFTPDVVERLREAGLKADRDSSIAISSLSALKALALFAAETDTTRQAVDALSLDGLSHQDPRVATLAAGMLAEIANRDHSRIPMLPLVALRTKGLARDVPHELTLTFLSTLAHIASPTVSVPGPDLKVSERAVQILFYDALSHSNPEIAELARRHLREVYTRRPDLFSGEMRETLATSR